MCGEVFEEWVERGVKVGWADGEGWHRQCEVLRLN